MSKLRVRNATDTGWINARTAAGFRVLGSTGWVNKTSTLAGLRVRNTDNTGWLSFEPEVRVLDFVNKNDLDFIYEQGDSGAAPNYVQLTCTVDVSGFFSRTVDPLDHAVFAIDCRGASHIPAYNPGTGTYSADHCGPIIRRGQFLWGGARGFILFRNGEVQAEQWYDWAGFALQVVPNGAGGSVNVSANPVLHVTLTGGYRTGPYANTMSLLIRSGSETGPLVFAGSVPWGWDWGGSSLGATALISMGFVDPALTGCTEQLLTRPGSLGATMSVTDLEVNYG